MFLLRVQQMPANCEYFPCHEMKDLDCRTCYCPIYDVCSEKRDSIFGGYYLKNTVWACEKCTYIHQKEVADKIFALKKQGKTEEEIYNICRGELRSPGGGLYGKYESFSL